MVCQFLHYFCPKNYLSFSELTTEKITIISYLFSSSYQCLQSKYISVLVIHRRHFCDRCKRKIFSHDIVALIEHSFKYFFREKIKNKANRYPFSLKNKLLIDQMC